MESLEYKISVMIVDSHEIMRVGMKFLISQNPQLQVIAEADSFTDTLAKISQDKPDIILLDDYLKDGNCTERFHELLNLCPHTKILLFTDNNDDQFHMYVLRLGVSGILHKSCSTELLLKAIEKVAKGHVWFERNLTQLFLKTKIEDDFSHITAKLSPKERTIACLASSGMSAKKISEQLFVAEKTIRNQLSFIYAKLNVKNHVSLCLEFSKVNFCELCPHDNTKCSNKKMLF